MQINQPSDRSLLIIINMPPSLLIINSLTFSDKSCDCSWKEEYLTLLSAMAGRNYYVKMYNYNKNRNDCRIDQKELKMNENKGNDALEIALLGKDVLNNCVDQRIVFDDLVKQLGTQYKITKIERYDETEKTTGPGKFIHDILSKYDYNYQSCGYRPFEMADSLSLKKMITISDGMYINCTHDQDEILSVWDKFHYYDRMSLYDNYLKLMHSGPEGFERKYLRHTFRKTIQKMKDLGMNLPKDFAPHYLVTENLWINKNNNNEYESSIVFCPYLNKENAIKERDLLNKTNDYMTRSEVVNCGDYSIVIKKENYD